MAKRNPSDDVEVVLLAERPELAEAVAAWVWDEWAHEWPGTTRESLAADVAAYVRRGALPLALVALRGGACVGTAALREHTAGFDEALAPWLVRVVVAPSARGTGVGKALVRAAETEARGLGFAALHLCTTDRQSFYAALGWDEIGEGTYHGHP
ncbi:MAG TPA: GNAT family N-acetyltransferase, partial [Longimicrobium sp.]|nr:GNAT family N-acetyltransferase [Longimicrobium sp.]